MDNSVCSMSGQRVCQCCGMPLNEEDVLSWEPDGTLNEDYCRWCYADGKFVYESREALLDFLIGHMPNPDNLDEKQRREQFSAFLSQLKHWQ